VNHKTNSSGTLLKILLVEDDQNDRLFFSFAVDEIGLPICLHTASNGQQAIEYLQALAPFNDIPLQPLPDLILLDLKMELKDGLDFLLWRREHPGLLAMPVILFTASQDEKEINRAMKLGAVAHICKPFSYDKLKGAVRQIWELGTGLRSSLRQGADTISVELPGNPVGRFPAAL
jgi:CheY-like chemotaxis protein